MQGFTLTFLLIIELFLDLFLGLNARVYPYFLAHYQAIRRLISRSRKQGSTHTCWLIIQLFLDLFLDLECKGLPLLVGLLSSFS